MICDHCEEEITGDAICLDCFNIALLENQPKKTAVELAAEEMYQAIKDVLECPLPINKSIINHKNYIGMFAIHGNRLQSLQDIITKIQGNPSPRPNLTKPNRK